MQDTKTGGNRWLPDIRPEEIDTYQETNNEETATYKLVDAHPILSRVLDKLAYFRTHAAAVWYNKLAGKSVKDKFDEVDASISSLNSRADVLENKLISFNVLMGQTATITESSTFTQMLFFQGNSASAYGAYILTGYGPGTTSRYHVASIFDNDAITVSISDNAFIIANNSGSDLYGRLLLINGPSPTIS